MRVGRLIPIFTLIALLVACGAEPAPAPADPVTPTMASTPTPGPTNTPQPTFTPVITATPLPTNPPEATQPPPPPTPIPAGARDFNLCVGIASDSNGFGHVTFKVPEQPIPIITYLPPLAVPLRVHLDAAGLNWLEIADHSQSAAGLTIASSNYLEGGQLGQLRDARCMLNIITPFYPDVAVNLSRPEDYIRNLTQLVRYLEEDIPEGHILLLNYYQTDRSDFTIDNSGRGLTPERIGAFNAAIAEACQPEGRFGGSPQVTCVDIRPYFDGFEDTSYVVKETTRTEFEAALYRSTSRTPQIQDYFAANPDGTIMGDGIHLSLAGRDALMRQLVDDIMHALRTQY